MTTDTSTIEQVGIIAHTKHAMSEYAAEVILDRAIPDYRDGLKPVHRLSLWQTHLSKLTPTAKHMKIAKLSGLVLGFHPHGSGSVDGAIVGMSQSWSRRMPLIDIHGNNGSIDGSDAAASRYIEGRQAVGAELLLTDIDKNAVDMVDNYDGTAKQPTVLPASLPHVLVNGTSGIAYGIATSIVPHNPVELVELMKLAITDSLSVESAKEVYHGPDFPTGNELVDSDPYQELTSNSATYCIRARATIRNHLIVIDEAPYGISTTKLVESMAKELDSIPEVTRIDDLSEHADHVHIEIFCKKNTSQQRMEEILALLEAKSALVQKISCNNVMIVGSSPQRLTLLDVIRKFVAFRSETLIRIWTHDIEVFTAKRALLLAEQLAMNHIDEIATMLKEATSRQHLITMLLSSFDINESQAEHIASMSLSKLLRKSVEQYEALLERIQQYTTDINNREYWLGNGHTERLLQDCDETIEKLITFGLSERKTRLGGTARTIDIKKAKTKSVKSLPRVVSISTEAPLLYCGTKEPTASNRISIETTTDKYIGAITKSGKMIVRFVNDMEIEERVNRTINEIEADDTFIAVFELNDSHSLVTLSKFGYMKRMLHKDIMPNVNQKRYIKRAITISGLKQGTDTLLAVYSTPTLEYTIVAEYDRSRKPIVEIEASTLEDRTDKGGSSGARIINTHNGKDRLISIKVVS